MMLTVLNGWQNAMIDGMENAAAERSVTSLKEARHTAVQRYGGPKIVSTIPPFPTCMKACAGHKGIRRRSLIFTK